jgi:hypothetical protein
VRGDERGRTLGFPTANLQPHNRVIPQNGVYVTATLIEGTWRRSVTNVGTRPTFRAGTSEPSVETYVMNWSGDLYGDVVRVRFLRRLRAERKFASVVELMSHAPRVISRMAACEIHWRLFEEDAEPPDHTKRRAVHSSLPTVHTRNHSHRWRGGAKYAAGRTNLKRI